MTTATKSKSKNPDAGLTFEQIAERKMGERITAYREAVARVAAGEELLPEELESVLEHLAYLDLPELAWRRDIAAHKTYTAAAAESAKLRKQRPENEARAAALFETLKRLREQVRQAESELYNCTSIVDSLQVGADRIINEHRVTHPHLFLDVADAVRLRLEARGKARKVVPATGSTESNPDIGWSK